MNLFMSKEFNSFQDLLLDQIQDLYDAEKRITQALPKMRDAAQSTQLKQAFEDHLHETENQVVRLEQVFQELGKQPERETCDAMKGLISEGEEMVDAKGDPAVKDAALIAAGQRVEHYEIAGYGTARNFAERLGHHNIAQQLQTTLDEERNADKLLSQIAEQTVNVAAATHP